MLSFFLKNSPFSTKSSRNLLFKDETCYIHYLSVLTCYYSLQLIFNCSLIKLSAMSAKLQQSGMSSRFFNAGIEKKGIWENYGFFHIRSPKMLSFCSLFFVKPALQTLQKESFEALLKNSVPWIWVSKVVYRSNSDLILDIFSLEVCRSRKGFFDTSSWGEIGLLEVHFLEGVQNGQKAFSSIISWIKCLKFIKSIFF